MSYPILLSQTAVPLLFQMFDSADGVTPKTGLSPTVTISKNGGSFASPSGAVTEVANGWYKVAGNATDSGTLGPLLLHATGTGANPTSLAFMVVAYDPRTASNLGITNLDGTISSRATQTSVDTVDDFLDTEVAAIKAKTDNLPASPAAVGSAMTLAADAIAAATIASDAITEIQSNLATATNVTSARDSVLTRLGTPADTDIATDVAAVKADTASVLARLGAWAGSGLNTVLGAFRAVVAKGAGLTPTDLSSGTTFDNTTDSVEALRDRGDVAWITGSSSGLTVEQAAQLTAIESGIDAMGSGTVTIVSPVSSDGSLSLTAGDDYYHANGRALSFTPDGAPNMTGGSCFLNVGGKFTATGTITSSTACRFDLTRAQTALLTGLTSTKYELKIRLADGHDLRPFIGYATITEGKTTS